MSEFGNSSNMINHLKYPETFINANIPKPIKFIQNNHRIVIRSEDRDRSKYSNPCEYRIELPCRFRNVSLFEIGSIMIPNFSNTEKYFIIQVEEIKDGVYTSSNKDICDAIALVPNSLGLNNYNYIYEKPGDTSFVKNFIKKFVDCPLASLSTITLKILKPDGNVMNFGNDMIPWDKEYSFKSFTNENNGTKLHLKFENDGHDLKQDDTVDDNKDGIVVFNAQVTYIDKKNNKKTTRSFPALNCTYDHDKVNLTTDENKTIILENDLIDITVDGDNKIKAIDQFVTSDDTNGPITISGNWKRAYNENGYYSRVKINSIDPASNNLLKITTAKNHNLKLHDRIYVDKYMEDPQTEWIKNYHVVVKFDDPPDDKVFYINKNNIPDHTLTSMAIADNFNTQNQSFLNNDDDLEEVNLSDEPDDEGHFFLQRYGEPDPSIQNMFIFNIGCREEDNDNVMSQNISYGNVKW